mgnify:CR=1 FL=1
MSSFDHVHNIGTLDGRAIMAWPNYGAAPAQTRRVSIHIEVLLDAPESQSDEQLLWHLEDIVTRHDGENQLTIHDALAIRIQAVQQ